MLHSRHQTYLSQSQPVEETACGLDLTNRNPQPSKYVEREPIARQQCQSQSCHQRLKTL